MAPGGAGASQGYKRRSGCSLSLLRARRRPRPSSLPTPCSLPTTPLSYSYRSRITYRLVLFVLGFCYLAAGSASNCRRQFSTILA
jgi:hypothetical protein